MPRSVMPVLPMWSPPDCRQRPCRSNIRAGGAIATCVSPLPTRASHPAATIWPLRNDVGIALLCRLVLDSRDVVVQEGGYQASDDRADEVDGELGPVVGAAPERLGEDRAEGTRGVHRGAGDGAGHPDVGRHHETDGETGESLGRPRVDGGAPDGHTEGEADEQEAGHVGPLEEHNHGHHGQRTEEHEDVSTDQLRDGALHKSRLGHSVTSRNELTGRWSERGSGSLLPDPRSFQVSVASNAFSYQRQTATFHWQ